MAKRKHIPTILGAQKVKYDTGGSITSMMNTIKNFGSTERDPTLGKNVSGSGWAAIAGEIGSKTVDFLDMIDALTDKNKDDYNPYKRIGLYGMGGHKSDGITGDSTITALSSGSMPAWSGGSNQLDLHNYKQEGSGIGNAGGGLSMSQGMGIADSLLKIASTSVGLAKPTTDYSEWKNSVERYKDSSIRGLDDINTNEGLRQAYKTTPLLGAGLTGRDFRNKSWLSDISTNIATSFEGFNAGANTGNGWAAAAGAILGGVGSAIGIGIGRAGANKRARWGNRLINKEVNPEINLALANTGEKVDTINDRRREEIAMGIPAAYGGKLDTHGADWDNDLTFIDLGGTHEENPYGGVFAGLGADGIPNLVEEDEVIWDDYVFSNRINVPEALAKKYKLGGKVTFAKAVRKLTEPSMERPNDPISKDTNNVILTEFKMAQETERMKREAQRQALINELIEAFAPDEMPEEQSSQQVPVEEPQQIAPEQQGQGLTLPEEEPVEEPPIPGFAEGGHLFARGGNTKNDDSPELQELKNKIRKRGEKLGLPDDQIERLLVDDIDMLKRLDLRTDDELKSLVADEEINPAVVTAEKGERIPLGEEEDNVWDIGEDEPILDDINDIGIDKDYDTIEPIYRKPNRGGTGLVDLIDEYKRSTNPVLEGSKVGAIYNYLRGPHDEEYDRMIGLGQGVSAPVSVPTATIGDYMQNKDFDSRYLVNLANANRAAAARTGMNTAAGNKALNLAYASMLAHNNQQELGDIMKQAYLAERQDDSLVSQFNRGTNSTNAQATNAMTQALAQLNSNRQIAGAGITERGLKGKHDAWTTWDTENGTNFTKYLENLNAVRNEQKEAQAINSIANLYGVSQNDDGTWSWENEDSAKQFFASDIFNRYLQSGKAKAKTPVVSALGGKIKRRRRF